MPSRTDVVRFSIDQSLSLGADQFEITLISSQPFVQRAQINLATIKSGLVDALGASKLVEHITAGVVDEIDLQVSPSSMETTVRGRDAAALLLDTSINITYGGPIKTAADVAAQAALFAETSLADVPGITSSIEMPGVWTASGIVRNLATRVGLDVAYLCPDYTLREPFSVSGSILAAIQTLVAPFSQFEPSRVDVWVDGRTLMVRSRPGVGGGAGTAGTPVPGAFNTFEARDGRITNLSFRHMTMGMTRVMRLTGRPDLSQRTACDFIVEETTENRGYDVRGEVTSKVVTTTTTKKPLGHVLKVYEEIYGTKTFDNVPLPGLTLLAVVKTTGTYDRPFYDENCNLLNSPKKRSEFVETDAYDLGDPDGTPSIPAGLKPFQQKRVSFDYDESDGPGQPGTLLQQVTETVQYNKDERTFEPLERATMNLVPTGILEYTAVTKKFNADGTMISQTSSPAGGHRPGGGGRRPSSNVADADNPFVIVELVDDDLHASDFQYDNKNLEDSHLRIIAQHCRDASGAEEIEVSFVAANIPWLRRGQMIQITNLDDENGDDIPLAPMLVLEHRLEYDGSQNPKYTSTVRAVSWTAA